MECKTFFYDNRLYNWATMEYDNVCKKLGSPIIMISNDMIQDHIHYYSYKDRYEVKFFYRVYYIGSALFSTIYNHPYLLKHYNTIKYELQNGKLPEIYSSKVIGHLTIEDIVKGDIFDTANENNNNEDEDENVSEDIMRLFENLKNPSDKPKQKQSEDSDVSNDKENDIPPTLQFKCQSYSEKAKIWESLPAEFRMDLIKNCIVIDALNNYFK